MKNWFILFSIILLTFSGNQIIYASVSSDKQQKVDEQDDQHNQEINNDEKVKRDGEPASHYSSDEKSSGDDDNTKKDDSQDGPERNSKDDNSKEEDSGKVEAEQKGEANDDSSLNEKSEEKSTNNDKEQEEVQVNNKNNDSKEKDEESSEREKDGNSNKNNDSSSTDNLKDGSTSNPEDQVKEGNNKDEKKLEDDKESTEKENTKARLNNQKSDGPLSKGMYRGDAITLKEHLNKLDFTNFNNPNNYFGPKTEQGVKDFQDYYGLEASGVANKTTLAKMEEILSSPFQSGKRHKDSVQLKEYLGVLGYVDFDNPTTYFGSITERAVKQFQHSEGLPQSGIIEPNTRSILKKKADGSLSKGMYREDVISLKEHLNRLDFTNFSNPNNYFGPKTEQGVQDFQDYYGLEASGVANKTTLAKMEEILSSPFQSGKRHKDSIQLKEYLGVLGYVDFDNPTTYFGSITERAVKQFQHFEGLPQSGIIEPNTRLILKKKADGSLSKGMYREDVIRLKEHLNRLDFTNFSNPNDYFGPKTEQGVKDFQDYYGLESSGVANETTLAKMEEILSSPFQSGKRHKDSIQLKEYLVMLGYVDFDNPTTYFGSITERAVKQFQYSEGLPQSGIIEPNTRSILKAKVEESLSKGMYRDDVITLKKHLNKLGFTNFGNPNNYFGPKTEQGVKDFQNYYGLISSGIANDITLNKIDEILSSPFQSGKRHKKTVQLKRDLERMGYLNFDNPTTYYGSITKKAVKKFQADYKLPISGIADKKTFVKIEEALKDFSYTNYKITLDEAVSKQMKAAPQTDKRQAWVSKKYIKNGKVTASVLNVRKGPGAPYKKVGSFKKGSKVKILDQYNGWYSIEYNHKEQWVHANPNDVKHHLNPNNFIDDSKRKFQFLDLSKHSGASKNLLDDYLKGKGTLDGQGQAFIDASKQQGVNDVYLISHASLETGNGTSKLASGVEVGKNKSGKPVLVTKKNKKNLKNIKKVYNMFGVHAFDNCALECGAKKAYKEGWTTPAKAIKGGASFIGNSYIKKEQNTIYQMRWNPVAMESGAPSHQYATDIGWATKQVDTMYNLYQSMKIKDLYLDIPEYK